MIRTSDSPGGRVRQAPTPEAEQVAEYYDRNTRRFLLVGRTGTSYAIHRQLWGPGVETPAQAAAHVNQLLVREIRGLGADPPGSVLDLGCGVGGTLFHLARAFPGTRLTGITISPRQVEVARRLSAEQEVSSRCDVRLGDFTALAPAPPGRGVEVAVAVESFVHAAHREAFLAAAAGQLVEGGVLLVVDDFLAGEEGLLSPAMQDEVSRFRQGWRVPGLCTAEALREGARDAGMEPVGSLDLTGLIRTGRPRDRLIGVLAPLFRRAGLVGIPFFGNMIGGNALQRGLRGGAIHYRMEIFRRGAASGAEAADAPLSRVSTRP